MHDKSVILNCRKQVDTFVDCCQVGRQLGDVKIWSRCPTFVHATFAYATSVRATFVHATSVHATFFHTTFVQGQNLVVYNCNHSCLDQTIKF